MAIAEDFAAELAAQGLPATATLAQLISHHRANAAQAAVFKAIGDGDIVLAPDSPSYFGD